MKTIILYIIKSILTTKAVSAIIVVVLSISSALFCISLDAGRQIMKDVIQKHLVEIGNSTVNMTFDEFSSVRFFSLSPLIQSQSYVESDFEYIIGGYKFTTVIRGVVADYPIKVHSYVNTFDKNMSGERVVNMFSNISIIEGRETPVWFDTDVVVPQSLAKKLGLTVGSEIELMLGITSKIMTVTAIAANKGLFSGDNILVDYEGLIGTVSSALPVSLPVNICNVALMRLFDSGKTDFYIDALRLIREYGDKAIQRSYDYEQLYRENKAGIAKREAIIYLMIVLLVFVVIFMAVGRLKAHENAIKIMIEQGAGIFTLCFLFLTEIALFGAVSAIIGGLFVVVSGLSALPIAALLSLPLCLAGYLIRFLSRFKKVLKYINMMLIVTFLIVYLFSFFFFVEMFFLLLLVILAFAVRFGDVLTRLILQAKPFKSIFAREKNRPDLNHMFDSLAKPSSIKVHRSLDKKDYKTEKRNDLSKPDKLNFSKIRNKGVLNKGVLKNFARFGADKSSSVFLVINSVLLVVVMIYASFLAPINKLLDTSEGRYVITNIASAGIDIVSEVEKIEGIEKTIPFYLMQKSPVGDTKESGILSDILYIRQSDYGYFKDLLSISGGSNALKEGQALISEALSIRFGFKVGQFISLSVKGKEINVEICAIAKSAVLNNFLIVGDNSGTLYNNILLKIDERLANAALNTIRIKYGLQNFVVVEKNVLITSFSNFAAELLDFLSLMLILLSALSMIIMLSLFLIKKSRESGTERIMRELGGSWGQVYGVSALSLLLSSIAAMIIGYLLSIGFLYLMSEFFSRLNAVIFINIKTLLPITLAAQAIILISYMAIHALSHLLWRVKSAK